MTPRERYKQITLRMNKLEGMRYQLNQDSEYRVGADMHPSDNFDHVEWVVAEKEALQLELAMLKDVMSSDGSIEY